MIVTESVFKGFCHGVSAAISVLKRAQYENESVSLTAPICHNRLVNTDVPVYDGMNSNAIVISAHGLSTSTRRIYAERGMKIYDATCPIVKNKLELLSEVADNLVYAGFDGHEEANAVKLSFRGKNFCIVSSMDELSGINLPDGKLFLGVQTTFPSHEFDKIYDCLMKNHEVEVVGGSICSDCYKRRRDIVNKFKGLDNIVVVGDKDSSNARQLLQQARSVCSSSHLVLDERETDVLDSLGGRTVGLISSASSPNDAYIRVKKYLEGK